MQDSNGTSKTKEKTVKSLVDDGANVSRSGFFAIIGGTTSALLSALVSAVLLLVNGSVTLVLLGSLVDAEPEWFHGPGLLQFALFTLPLVMLVAEWMAWDFFSGLLARESCDES